MSFLVSFMPLKILPESYRRKKKKKSLTVQWKRYVFCNFAFDFSVRVNMLSRLLMVYVVPLSC